MKILVTGSTGFVGGNLAEHLIAQHADLRLMVRDPAKLDASKINGAEIVTGDITDADAVRRAVEGVDLVYAIAGTFREPNLSDQSYRTVNVEAVRLIADAAVEAGVKRLVFCSTGGIHGPNDGKRPTHEDDPPLCKGIYEISKAEGDAMALAYGKQGKLETVAIRPAPIYGPGDDRLIKLFKIAGKRKPLVLGDGKSLYHMIYIDDLSDAFIKAGTVEDISGQAFLIGGPDKPNKLELFAAIGSSVGITDQTPRKLPVGPFLVAGDICEAICRPLNISPPIYRRRVEFFTSSRDYDIGKAKRMLGFTARTGHVEGIAKTAAWYKQQGYI